MKLKKLAIGFGALFAVATPIATVVSCRPKRPFHPEWTTDNDLKWNGDGQENLGILNSDKIISMSADIQAFPIAADDIFEFAFNTKNDGILNVTRLQDFYKKRGYFGSNYKLENLIDTSVNGLSGQPQSLTQDDSTYKNINALWTKHVTKSEMVTNPSIMSPIAAEVSAFVKSKPNVHLGAFVIADKEDELDDKTQKYASGEYSIYIFQLKNNSSQKIQAATSLLQDPTKFGADVAGLAKYGGTYTTAYGFGSVVFDPSANSLLAPEATPNSVDDGYGDRVLGSSLKDYYQWGPKVDDSGNIVLSQGEIDSIQGLKFAAYYVTNQKTKVQNLIFTIADGSEDANGLFVLSDLKTISIAVPELMTIVPKQDFLNASNDDLKSLTSTITNDLSFSKLYNILKGIAPKLGFLSSYPSTTVKIIELFQSLKLMYQYERFITHTEPNGNIDAFKAFVKALPLIDPDFNLNMFRQIIEYQKGKDFGAVGTYGGKRYQVIDVVPRFYQDIKIFIDAHPEYKNLVLELGGKND